MRISPTPPFPAAYFETTKINRASQQNNWYILVSIIEAAFSYKIKLVQDIFVNRDE
jgi:hypothetical protein